MTRAEAAHSLPRSPAERRLRGLYSILIAFGGYPSALVCSFSGISGVANPQPEAKRMQQKENANGTFEAPQKKHTEEYTSDSHLSAPFDTRLKIVLPDTCRIYMREPWSVGSDQLENIVENRRWKYIALLRKQKSPNGPRK